MQQVHELANFAAGDHGGAAVPLTTWTPEDPAAKRAIAEYASIWIKAPAAPATACGRRWRAVLGRSGWDRPPTPEPDSAPDSGRVKGAARRSAMASGHP